MWTALAQWNVAKARTGLDGWGLIKLIQPPKTVWTDTQSFLASCSPTLRQPSSRSYGWGGHPCCPHLRSGQQLLHFTIFTFSNPGMTDFDPQDVVGLQLSTALTSQSVIVSKHLTLIRTAIKNLMYYNYSLLSYPHSCPTIPVLLLLIMTIIMTTAMVMMINYWSAMETPGQTMSYG